MKYIKVETELAETIIFLFPRIIHHDQFYKSIAGRTPYPISILSAGFYSLPEGCFGRSESLNVNSDPAEDTLLVIEQFNLGAEL